MRQISAISLLLMLLLMTACAHKPEPPEKPAPPVAFSDSVPAADASKPAVIPVPAVNFGHETVAPINGSCPAGYTLGMAANTAVCTKH